MVGGESVLATKLLDIRQELLGLPSDLYDLFQQLSPLLSPQHLPLGDHVAIESLHVGIFVPVPDCALPFLPELADFPLQPRQLIRAMV